MYRSSVALGASFVISVGLLVTAIGATSHLKGGFTGSMRVVEGRQECLAVRLDRSRNAEALEQSASVVSGVPGSEIPFQNPDTARNWIDPGSSYTVAQLPFFVRLDRIEVVSRPAPHNRIRVVSPQGDTTQRIEPGGIADLPGATMRVNTVRKWSGLLRQEGGRPMASVALRQGEESWSEKLFLTAGIWLRVGPEVGLLLHRVESEEAARAALEAGLPSVGKPRWGVVDRGAVNWFASFVPGTGVGLPDGGSVTLVRIGDGSQEDADKGSAILVEIEREGRLERRWVFANQSPEDPLVRFDHPLGRPVTFVLLAWQEGRAMAAAFRQGQARGTHLLEDGDIWSDTETGWALQLDAVLASAVPVNPDDSPLFEALVGIEGETLSLREGEAIRWNELMLQFERDEPPPRMTYGLSLLDEKGDTVGSGILGNRAVLEEQGWVIARGVADARRLDTAVLTVSMVPPRRTTRWGAVVCALGLVGLASSLLFRKRPIGPS